MMETISSPASWTNLLYLAFTAVVVSSLIYIKFFYVDIPRIDGIPEIPGADLLAGHFYNLGKDHASKAELWSSKYNWPVFQLRMGRRRAIVLNSFDSAREWIVKNQSATLDRPWFYTFHGVLSKTSGICETQVSVVSCSRTNKSAAAATIGTSPWNDQTKKQRRIVGSFTTGPAITKLQPMLDLETCAMISGVYYDSNNGTEPILPHVYQKRVALNIMTMFCYNTRFSSVWDPLLLQILKDATTIARCVSVPFECSVLNS